MICHVEWGKHTIHAEHEGCAKTTISSVYQNEEDYAWLRVWDNQSDSDVDCLND